MHTHAPTADSVYVHTHVPIWSVAVCCSVLQCVRVCMCACVCVPLTFSFGMRRDAVEIEKK